MSSQLPYQIQQEIARQVQQAQMAMHQSVNQAAASVRGDVSKRVQAVDQRLNDLARIAESLRVQREHTGIVRIEDIPGRRVPFDYFVDIPIDNNDTSRREASITISQEGPFVAVRRFAVFQSLYQYSVSSGGSTAPAKYVGRSYGRWRPISSVYDYNDAHNNNSVQTPNPMTSGVYIGNLELPSSQSGFRTMEFDGKIFVMNAGSSFPRMNTPVPSALWSDGIGGLADLGCLDFFERGEVISFQVQPNRVNNPPAGNVDGTNIFGVAGYPFTAGQYDQHEGIITPSAFSIASSSPPTLTRLATDSVSRLPDGVLTIGFVGYRIQQPPGV